MNKGILKLMAETKDMYKLTRFVNSRRYFSKADANNMRTDLDARLELADMYAKRYPAIKLDDIATLKLVNRTESNEYIRIIRDDGKTLYDLTDKGFHLIGKSYYFFRVGLWDETSKHYDKTQTLFVTVVVSVISAVGGAVIGYIIGRI